MRHVRMLTCAPPMTNRGLVACAFAVAAVAWLFGGPLFAGRALYFRDVGVTYYPDFVLVSRALAQGVGRSGTPGRTPALRSSWPTRFTSPSCFWEALARRSPFRPRCTSSWRWRGRRPSPAASEPPRRAPPSRGGVFGLSGLMLGSVLYPVFLAAAWAPLAVERFLALVLAPSPRRAASSRPRVAVQASTLGVEAVLQTALVALVLVPRWPGRRAAVAATGSLLVAASPRRRRCSAPRRCSRAPRGGGVSRPRWA